jgi:hypothetical protein
LRVLVDLLLGDAQCVVDLGDALRINPTDEAVAARGDPAMLVEVVYHGDTH